MAEDTLDILALLEAPGQQGFLATLVSVEGSSYRRPGARLVWWSDGRRAGAISGGCLEEDIILHGREVIASGQGRVLVYHTDSEGDPVFGLGTGCDGTLRVVLEPLGPEPHVLTEARRYWLEGRALPVVTKWEEVIGQGTSLREGSVAVEGEAFVEDLAPPTELWIFGAGDDAVPLVEGARWLGWRIHIVDTRPARVAPGVFPGAELHLVGTSLGEALASFNAGACAVVMSHRYRDDLRYLEALAKRPCRYLGVLGPRRRAERLLAELAGDLGVATEALRARLHAPIGLFLGGDGARAVALSVLAEIQSVLRGGDGRPHRERTQPIHR